MPNQAFALLTCFLACVGASVATIGASDQVENPAVAKVLVRDMDVEGEWARSKLPRREGETLTIEEDPVQQGTYRLEFVRWTDYSKPRREKRTAKFRDGILT